LKFALLGQHWQGCQQGRVERKIVREREKRKLSGKKYLHAIRKTRKERREMSNLKSTICWGLFGASLLCSTSLMASPVPRTGQDQSTSDNTKVNKGDADKDAATADKQKMNPADRDTAKQIRASIMSDRSLSTYAQNVKIITRNGKVTLKGPVRSDDERSNLETKAVAVAGAGNVSNQLTIAPPKQ
jgi:hypothetical protein